MNFVNSATKVKVATFKHFAMMISENMQHHLCCSLLSKFRNLRKSACDIFEFIIWLTRPPSAHLTSWQLQRTGISISKARGSCGFCAWHEFPKFSQTLCSLGIWCQTVKNFKHVILSDRNGAKLRA